MHIRLKKAKSANFMHFHFADNRTVQILDGNLAYENTAHADSEVLVTPKNVADSQHAYDTQNVAHPNVPF